MAFKPVQRIRGSINPTPSVTVAGGELHFNKSASVAFDIDEYDFVELHVDDDTDRMGVKLLTERSGIANKLRADGARNRSKRSVSAGDWIKQFSLVPGTYPLAEENGLLTFDRVSQAEVDAAGDEDEDSEVSYRSARRRGRPRKAA